MAEGEGPADWLDRMLPDRENDPEYLRARIELLEGELRHTYPAPRADVKALVEAAAATVERCLYMDDGELSAHLDNCARYEHGPDEPCDCPLGPLYAALSRLKQAPPRASGDGPLDLSCPGCGGPTEIDREYPPNPFYCESCDSGASGDGREEKA